MYLVLLLSMIACQNTERSEHNAADEMVEIEQNFELDDVSVSVVTVPDYDTLVWAEVTTAPSIQLDIRYATENNFTKETIYNCGRCFLRRKTAEIFYEILNDLNEQGYGVKLFDCYRPRPAQYKLWEIVPNPMYVADPKKGSMHNRGLALDLTLTDLTGQELNMGTEFDFFGRRAYHDFLDLPKEILKRRQVLKETMARHGFKHTRTEWWHYSDTKNKGAIADFEWNCAE